MGGDQGVLPTDAAKIRLPHVAHSHTLKPHPLHPKASVINSVPGFLGIFTIRQLNDPILAQETILRLQPRS